MSAPRILPQENDALDKSLERLAHRLQTTDFSPESARRAALRAALYERRARALRRKRLMTSFRSTVAAAVALLVLVFAGLGIRWSIQHGIPAAQPSPTPPPGASATPAAETSNGNFHVAAEQCASGNDIELYRETAAAGPIRFTVAVECDPASAAALDPHGRPVLQGIRLTRAWETTAPLHGAYEVYEGYGENRYLTASGDFEAASRSTSTGLFPLPAAFTPDEAGWWRYYFYVAPAGAETPYTVVFSFRSLPAEDGYQLSDFSLRSVGTAPPPEPTASPQPTPEAHPLTPQMPPEDLLAYGNSPRWESLWVEGRFLIPTGGSAQETVFVQAALLSSGTGGVLLSASTENEGERPPELAPAVYISFDGQTERRMVLPGNTAIPPEERAAPPLHLIDPYGAWLFPPADIPATLHLQTAGEDTTAGRAAVIVETYTTSPDAPADLLLARYWLDAETGMMLRYQAFGQRSGSGETVLTGEWRADTVLYDLPLPQEMLPPQSPPASFLDSPLGATPAPDAVLYLVAHPLWEQVWMLGHLQEHLMITDSLGGVNFYTEAWLDRSSRQGRVVLGDDLEAPPQSMWVSDGDQIFRSDGPPSPAGTHSIHPLRTAGPFMRDIIPTLADLPEGVPAVKGWDTYLQRPAVILDWMRYGEQNPSARMWVDAQTGFVLRRQVLSPVDSSVNLDESAEGIAYGVSLPAYVTQTYNPQFDKGPAPSGFDPSDLPLTTQSVGPDSEPPRETFLVDLFAGGYYLGTVESGDAPLYGCVRSPLGDKLAFLYLSPTGRAALRWLDLRDASRTFAPRKDLVLDAPPAWSPDGERLIFTACDAASCGLYLLRPESGENALIAPLPAASFVEPLWGPDGNAAAVLIPAGEGLTLRVIRLSDGSAIYEGPFDAETWQPPADSPLTAWKVNFPRQGASNSCLQAPPSP